MVLFIAKQALFHSKFYATVANLHDGGWANGQVGINAHSTTYANGWADLLTL